MVGRIGGIPLERVFIPNGFAKSPQISGCDFKRALWQIDFDHLLVVHRCTVNIVITLLLLCLWLFNKNMFSGGPSFWDLPTTGFNSAREAFVVRNRGLELPEGL